MKTNKNLNKKDRFETKTSENKYEIIKEVRNQGLIFVGKTAIKELDDESIEKVGE